MMLVLLLTMGVAALSGGVAVLAHTEQVIAASQARTIQTAYAAEAAASLAIDAIARVPESRLWPSAGDIDGLTGGARAMSIAPGELLDLDARTMELNQAALRQWPLGADTPQWRLAGWGRLPGLTQAVAEAAPRVAVWISDDLRDRDGVAGEDQNGAMMVRAEAYGARGALRGVLVHLRREAGRVRVVSWRPVL